MAPVAARGPAVHACRVCDSHGHHPVFVAREMMYGLREPFEYFQCTNCGCLQIAAIPPDMGPYYRGDYYSLRGGHEAAYRHPLKNWLNRLRDQAMLFAPGGDALPLRVSVPSLRAAYSAIRRVPRLSLRSRIVDVGCGGGQLLYRLRNAGFTSLLGIDPFLPEERQVDATLRFKRCSLEALDGLFDLIMMHHSFEHMEAPRAVFRKLQTLLAPGGTALVRIPVADCAAWEEYGVDWFQLDAPRHLYLHTRKSMQSLAQQGGLARVASYCDSDEHQFLVSEKYRRGIPTLLPPGYSGPRFQASDEQVQQWRTRARALNREGRGDQAVFFFEAA
ncbi:class I SAM-dependent methyltransferase [Roseateles cellulosilyticus]|uniref:Class I SAM-dependent methyltransferase n=1 Tax=Pelomonas cellulosilytica TaxID=2906762 RepID=A0ABS8Y2G2_9BURK|nr:class I SAM-dependent methyltransferase [Pelomonas sp. P8]MCE4557281.1 class I SAM-dependent methyltransferase [Pelomonas sp. P8]